MTDAAYRTWVQTLPSCLDGRSFSEWVTELGAWRNLACHVRRAGRSGIAHKEEFACIPMTDTQHRFQHNRGELACLRKFSNDPQLRSTLEAASMVEAERIAGEWFDAQVERYHARWAAETEEGRRWALAQKVDVTA